MIGAGRDGGQRAGGGAGVAAAAPAAAGGLPAARRGPATLPTSTRHSHPRTRGRGGRAAGSVISNTAVNEIFHSALIGPPPC